MCAKGYAKVCSSQTARAPEEIGMLEYASVGPFWAQFGPKHFHGSSSVLFLGTGLEFNSRFGN